MTSNTSSFRKAALMATLALTTALGSIAMAETNVTVGRITLSDTRI